MYRKRINLNWLLTIVAILVLIGAVAGLYALTNKDKASEGYELADVSFSIGELDATGNYKESKKALYTKEAFECQAGVKAELEFDSNIKWQVFYYDELDEFISSTDSFTKTGSTVAPEGATHARVMITPIWDEELDEDKQVIKWYNANKYEKQIVVSVAEIEEEDSTVEA